MRVLVTGGCGFLGSHVCEHFKNLGDEVVAFDSLTKHELIRTGFAVERARLYNWNLLKQIGVVLVKGDIRDKKALSEAADDCDYIVHTAAQPAMTISIENPDLDLTTNVMGTFNILELARRRDIPVSVCSTIHVYGNKINETLLEQATRFVHDPPTFDENHPILQGKITPLHASKRSAEIYANAFIDTYGLKASVFRLTGMYGPRQFGGEDHGWVANFAIRTVLALPIKVFGTGKQVRDILYATDAAASFDAYFRNQKPGIYNIGGGIENSISLSECLELLSEISGRKQKIERLEKRDMDLWYFVCDISKAKSVLSWEPKISNEEGLKRMVTWIEKNARLLGS
jgi:CDP-paratose 2-epimerase